VETDGLDDRFRKLEATVDEIDTRLDTMQALAGIPDLVLTLREDLWAVRRDVRQMRQRMDARFDDVDAAHAAAKGIDWKTVFTLAVASASGIGMPYVLIHGL
jgi:Zn-finger domain-containing protein